MSIVLPLVIDGRLICSSVLVNIQGDNGIFASTLHQIGNAKKFEIAVPSHKGVISAVQEYPLTSIPTVIAELFKVEPLYDLAFFKVKGTTGTVPHIHTQLNEINIGEDVIVAGYPYANLGSALETAHIATVSAKGKRVFMNKFKIEELIISHQTLQGSSGSAVIRRSDGSFLGIVRGTLAPSTSITIGDMPLATDSNVTYVTFSSIIKTILKL